MRDFGIDRDRLGMLRRTAAACRARYRGCANVLDVAVGLKQTRGRVDPAVACVQFIVRRKLGVRRADRLPRFVYARDADGRIDRGCRIPTDVLAVGDIECVCRSGYPVEGFGAFGGLTLLFSPAGTEANGVHLLTCAHVVGAPDEAFPVNDRLVVHLPSGLRRQGRILAKSALLGGSLSYDIALASLNVPMESTAVLRVSGSERKLEGFLPASEFWPGLMLEGALPVSHAVSAHVLSSRLALPIRFHEITVIVENLFMIDLVPQQGDSGGLLYRDGLAAGMVVARCGCGGLFQPLGEAVSHLAAASCIPIVCFP